jgi:hypothetical protein
MRRLTDISNTEGAARKFLLRMLPVVLATLFAWLHAGGQAAQQTSAATEPFKFFREYVHLDEKQIQSIRNGEAVARVLDAPTADQVFVFGGVYVKSTPEKYLAMASDVDALRKLPNYLAIVKFSDPPKLSDLDQLKLEDKDIEELKKCKTGKCEVQLPSEAIDAFNAQVNWNAADAVDQANALARKMVLEMLVNYQQGGNAALGTYRDKSHPAVVADTFRALVSRSEAMPVYLPELRSYLLDYPKAKADHIQSQFYWEKVNFGLKPTVRVVQAVVYRGAAATDPAYAVAVKQLYSSHYFESALDLTVCERDQEGRGGFYIVTLKGSQQAGLTGFQGSIVRKVAVDKTRSSLEKALAAMKEKLEAEPK